MLDLTDAEPVVVYAVRMNRLPSTILWLGLACLSPAPLLGQTETADTAINRPGIGTVVSALDRVATETNELMALGSLAFSDIRIVNVGAVLGQEDLRLFDEAFARNRSRVVELRKVLATSDIQVVGKNRFILSLREFLNDTVGVNDVVAVNVSGGTVTLFVDEPVALIGMSR